MTQLALVLDLAHATIEQIEATPRVLTLSLTMNTSESCCPLCGHASHRVHSRYVRTLQDVPCGGKVLRLLVHVRRFFCTNSHCVRKIFAERLPDLTTVYARRTTRCTQALTELAFALGGKAGADVGGHLGLPSTRTTLLRLLRRTSCSSEAVPRLLGVDEFAFRRGKTYGTILVDLERGTPVDLLADKHAKTFAAWLKEHPGVQLISRDRAGEFALGAAQGAPEAIQVADRFHLLRNLAEVIEQFLGRHRKALKQIHLVVQPSSSPSAFPRHIRPDRERRKQRARAVLVERYEAVQRLVAQGMSLSAIARQLHLARGTVIRYARAEHFPERPEQPARPGLLAAYETYLKTRFLQGERNGVGLWRELVADGYTGSRMTVERFLLGLRVMEQQGREIAPTTSTKEMTPHRVVGLMLRPDEKQTKEEKIVLKQVCQLHSDVDQVQRLFQHFIQMVRQRRGEDLEQWLDAAFSSGIAELRSFVNKLRQDQQAVQAGLVLKWNNGVVEGHVNRLKLLKRSMYGRANFDLLRVRVLHHRKWA